MLSRQFCDIQVCSLQLEEDVLLVTIKSCNVFQFFVTSCAHRGDSSWNVWMGPSYKPQSSNLESICKTFTQEGSIHNITEGLLSGGHNLEVCRILRRFLCKIFYLCITPKNHRASLFIFHVIPFHLFRFTIFKSSMSSLSLPAE